MIDEEKIKELTNTIKKNKNLRERDKEILSVAMRKIDDSINEYKKTIIAKENNIYKDMILYYDEKIELLANVVECEFNRIQDLYYVAMKKEETLIKYILKNERGG